MSKARRKLRTKQKTLADRSSPETVNKRHSQYYLAAFVSLVTFAVYLPALWNKFVIWDDPLYVVGNYHIRSLNVSFFRWAFSSYYAANWHPLTWMSHALDYAVWGLNPLGHHLTNVLLHAGNTFLVVLLCVKLQEMLKERSAHGSNEIFPDRRRVLIAAGVAGLLFGLHPVHVESVAWVSERKDVLCGLFFLLSISAYASYVRIQGTGPVQEHRTSSRIFHKTYLLSLAFFMLALLSKPMAVTLPVVLLILDYYPFQRVSSLRSFRIVCMEKLPYALLSLVASYLTIMAQRSEKAMELIAAVPLMGRLLVAARAVIAYLGKMAVPVDLSPFYPYPKPHEVLLFSSHYLFVDIGVVVIIALYFMIAKKRVLLLSALGYYGVTLLPVIGIVQVGIQSMADRYTYLPSLGPFLITGLAGAWVWEKAFVLKQWGRTVGLFTAVAAIAVVIFLFSATGKQISIWKNSIDLWSFVIEKDPTKKVVFAYINRGMAFKENGQLDRALEDYAAAISLDPANPAAYYNRGNLFGEMGQLDRAIEDYTAAIAQNPAYSFAYSNRGILSGKKGELDRAIEDFTKAISLRPGFADDYVHRGKAFKEKGLLDRALEDDTAAIALNPSSVEAYNNRGVVFKNLNQFDRALSDYDRAIALNPSFYLAYCNRGLLLSKMGLADKAIEDYTMALSLRPDLAQAYLERGTAYQMMGSSKLAQSDYNKACDLGNKTGCDALRASRHGRALDEQ